MTDVRFDDEALRWYVFHPDEAAELVTEAWFDDPLHREAFEALCAVMAGGGLAPVNGARPEVRRLLRSVGYGGWLPGRRSVG